MEGFFWMVTSRGFVVHVYLCKLIVFVERFVIFSRINRSLKLSAGPNDIGKQHSGVLPYSLLSCHLYQQTRKEAFLRSEENPLSAVQAGHAVKPCSCVLFSLATDNVPQRPATLTAQLPQNTS
jgi:hypothetical protein